ncbi:unnamed protein product [Cylindrotheca closterium]|uniref:Uncharacterized protein n=1 Tax=Cylindrotheca closterium TaxID=2856 RepID=A0AAD2CLW8_9STRA|nr:unnamed protein product [Cylindrotheca closterium]
MKFLVFALLLASTVSLARSAAPEAPPGTEYLGEGFCVPVLLGYSSNNHGGQGYDLCETLEPKSATECHELCLSTPGRLQGFLLSDIVDASEDFYSFDVGDADEGKCTCLYDGGSLEWDLQETTGRKPPGFNYCANSSSAVLDPVYDFSAKEGTFCYREQAIVSRPPPIPEVTGVDPASP